MRDLAQRGLTDRHDEVVGRPSSGSRSRSLGPRRPSWWRGYLAVVLAADLTGAFVGGAVAYLLHRANPANWIAGSSLDQSYIVITGMVALLWVVTLVLCRVYTVRVLGSGSDEYRRILDAVVRLLVGVAAVAFFTRADLSRLYVSVVTPTVLGWTLLCHWGARQWLHRRRQVGACQQETVVVGSPSHVVTLVDHLRLYPYVGFKVVGACTGGPDDHVDVSDGVLPVVASPADLVGWIQASSARAVIVADAAVLGPGALRQFAWRLEGLGVDLMVAPSVSGVAGPRIGVRPVEGVPLLHLEEPRFDGVTRLVKGIVERVAAAGILVPSLPALALVALLVKVTSRGPIFYRHTRIGRAGVPFQMIKFRTMVDGADKLRNGLAAGNDHGEDPLFKMRSDPRVTTLGRWLRRLSIDELPQLAHVVSGRMSIVGPRPPLPDEVLRYTDDAWRRLLVRPGITGLWQVSGRSSLPWVETLRLDLYYVDNWSLAFDLVICIKTLNAVVRGSGAY